MTSPPTPATPPRTADSPDIAHGGRLTPPAPGQAVALPPRIVLYDGVCGLCHKAVQWLMKRDPDRRFHFAPLQGETAAGLRARHPEIPANLDTVVYVEDGRVHLRSKAFLYAARHLPRPWRWGYHVRWLPAFLLDLIYRVVARIRYRVWGRYDACQLPTTDEKSRLLP